MLLILWALVLVLPEDKTIELKVPDSYIAERIVVRKKTFMLLLKLNLTYSQVEQNFTLQFVS